LLRSLCYNPSMKTKSKSVSQLKKEADATFSQYIRQKYADPHTGLVSCVTCGIMKPWKEMQAGHYESRGNNFLRYDERNVHVQCYGCNVARKGNYPAYATFMVRTYGTDILETLREESKFSLKFTTAELQEIIDTYKEKLKGLTTP